MPCYIRVPYSSKLEKFCLGLILNVRKKRKVLSTIFFSFNDYYMYTSINHDNIYIYIYPCGKYWIKKNNSPKTLKTFSPRRGYVWEKKKSSINHVKGMKTNKPLLCLLCWCLKEIYRGKIPIWIVPIKTQEAAFFSAPDMKEDLK